MKYQPIRFPLFILCLLTTGTLLAQTDEAPKVPAEGVFVTESLNAPNTSLQPMTLLIPAPKLSVPTASPIEVAPSGINPQAPHAPIVQVVNLDKPVLNGQPLSPINHSEPESVGRLEAGADNLLRAQSQDPSGKSSGRILDALYTNGASAGPVEPITLSGLDAFRNGKLHLLGRTLYIDRKIEKLITKHDIRHGGSVNLDETLSVTITDPDGKVRRVSILQDTERDVWAKLKILDYIITKNKISDNNLHLEETLLWVDAILNNGNQKTAVHTYSAYFHPSPNHESNVTEGNKRIDQYFNDTVPLLSPGGKLARKLKGIAHRILGFDTRGYKELKDHVKEKGAPYKNLFEFVFLDDIIPNRPSDEVVRQELNALIEKYQHHVDGLAKIIEGVVYSRYTGLELELRTIDYLIENGWEILQSGRDLFDEKGFYKTELDIVARKKTATGYRYILVECKGARVHVSLHDAEEGKIVYKLRTYDEVRDLIKRTSMDGQNFETVFSVNVGNNIDFKKDFEDHTQPWSEKFKQKVSFIFWGNNPLSESKKPGDDTELLPSSFVP